MGPGCYQDVVRLFPEHKRFILEKLLGTNGSGPSGITETDVLSSSLCHSKLPPCCLAHERGLEKVEWVWVLGPEKAPKKAQRKAPNAQFPSQVKAVDLQQGALSSRIGSQPPPHDPRGWVNTSSTERPSKQSGKHCLFNPLWWKAITLGLRIFSASKEKLSGGPGERSIQQTALPAWRALER